MGVCLLSKWDFNLLHDMYITFSFSVQTLGVLAVPSVWDYTTHVKVFLVVSFLH